MSDKLTILIAYALSGIALALAPFVLRRLHGQSRTWEAAGTVFGHERCASAIGIAFAIIALSLSRSLASPVVALVFVIVALHRGRADRDEAGGAVAAGVIAATLPWWRRDDNGLLLMDWTKLPVFFLATLLVCHALRLAMPQAPSPRGGKKGYFTLLAVLVVVFHGPANYFYLPPEMRREFLLNTAQTLRRAGWLVVLRQAQKSGERDPDGVRLVDSSELLQDIYRIYRPTQDLNFGSYHAIRFEPR